MNLIIDIGNTCVKLVCFDNGQVVEERRTDKGDICALTDFLCKYQFACGIYSSVSDLTSDYRQTLERIPFPMIEFKSGITPIPIINKYRSPLTLGTDRLAAAVGAHYLQPGRDILIVDVGTCVTFDFVSSAGEYQGGNISPGPSMRLKALHQFTSRLPLVERNGAIPSIGIDTETAIRCGVINGIKYEIEGYVRHFTQKNPNLFVYLTGGVHLNLQFPENLLIFADDFIVPKGLNRILEYNNEIK